LFIITNEQCNQTALFFIFAIGLPRFKNVGNKEQDKESKRAKDFPLADLNSHRCHVGV
jgi:hypothetical protein